MRGSPDCVPHALLPATGLPALRDLDLIVIHSSEKWPNGMKRLDTRNIRLDSVLLVSVEMGRGLEGFLR